MRGRKVEIILIQTSVKRAKLGGNRIVISLNVKLTETAFSKPIFVGPRNGLK